MISGSGSKISAKSACRYLPKRGSKRYADVRFGSPTQYSGSIKLQ